MKKQIKLMAIVLGMVAILSGLTSCSKSGNRKARVRNIETNIIVGVQLPESSVYIVGDTILVNVIYNTIFEYSGELTSYSKYKYVKCVIESGGKR